MVNDDLADSPRVARTWCPGCEPDADPLTEILDLRHCDYHAPTRDGADDAGVSANYVSGTAEAGGESNRLWCQFFHPR